MSEGPIDERTFSDREVREILKRAVRSPSRAVAHRDGLSLRELKAIGEEVGIDPALVERAAHDVARRRERPFGGLIGTPLEIEAERRVPGALDPEDTADALTLIRRAMGRSGEVREIHGVLEWKGSSDSGEQHVTISTKDGVTTVRGSANIVNAAVGTYLPAGMFGVIMTFAWVSKFMKTGSEVALVLGLAILPVLYPVLRTLLQGFSRSAERRLQEAVDGVAGLISNPEDPEA